MTKRHLSPHFQHLTHHFGGAFFPSFFFRALRLSFLSSTLGISLSGLKSGHDGHNDSLASSRISPRSCCQGIFSIQVEMGLVCPLCHDAGRSRSPAGRPNFRLESMWHWFSSIAQRTRNLGLCDLVLGTRSAPRIDWALDPHGSRRNRLLFAEEVISVIIV